MSTQPDWSKAPEGATHWDPVDQNWLRQFGGLAFNWLESSGEWVRKGWQYPDELSIMPRLIVRSIWTGEGLPPVGAVCEVDIESWHICEVIAHFQQRCGMVAAFTIERGDGAKILDSYGEGCFRPIRTPEQIAAEEREAAIAQMKECFDSVSDSLMPTSNWYLETLFGALHDAGYRKQVKP